jgi:hypothetical protein
MYKSTGEFWRRAENVFLDFEQSFEGSVKHTEFWPPLVTGWWFQTFLLSISYMGCHLSHWRTP